MNRKLDWRLLKKLYAIHSPSGKESRMTDFLLSLIQSLPGDIKLGKDTYGNLYARKGESESYPCIVAHMDQVQRVHSSDFRAIEAGEIIFGYSARHHRIEGLGADDKNGIFIALEALRKYDCLKAVFFIEEETGCHGSQNCMMSFFDDCRFVMECDRRGSFDLITSIGCTDLCSQKFIGDIDPGRWGYRQEQGMMTDVKVLKERGLPVSAVNISCGYYDPHTDREITDKRDLEKCWRLVQHIVEDCTDIYTHEVGETGRFSYYDEWELEGEIHSILMNDPTVTSDDLYEMYHETFPGLKLEDFGRIVEEYHLWYDYDEDTDISEYQKN